MKFLNSDLVLKSFTWAEKNLRPSLLEREEQTEFDPSLWKSAQETLGLNEFYFSESSELEKVKALASTFFGLARGSFDLPFCSSLAAHSVISMDLVSHFMTDEQRKKYAPFMRDSTTIAAVCNSEEGAGSDLKKIKALAEVDAEGTARLNVFKPCATNASHADLFLVSIFVREINKKDRLEVVMLERAEVRQWSLQKELAGFRTGITGGIETQNLKIKLSDRLLKSKAKSDSGEIQLFKRCFDMERLFLGIMVAGILQGVEEEMRRFILAKESGGFKFQDKQYLQEKLIEVYSVKTQMMSVIDAILNHPVLDLNHFSRELAYLKILMNTQGFEAIKRFYELVGHRGYFNDQLCQKLMRDFMGLSYFGGTVELQKNTLFQEILKADGFSSETTRLAKTG